MTSFYPDRIWQTAVINPAKYKGRGRPKLTDYMPYISEKPTLYPVPEIFKEARKLKI